jgi:FixJ family two-component response regulator
MQDKAHGPCLVSIVDDDKAVRHSLGNLLESVGLATESFASAEEFLVCSQAERRSCLILDVQLPEMNGIELQRLLLSQSKSIPIILITAHTDNNLRSLALRNGAVDFFYKPFNAEALLAAVRIAVTRSNIRKG